LRRVLQEMPQFCVYWGNRGHPLPEPPTEPLPYLDKKSDPVAEQFYTNGHEVAYFSVMGFEKLNGSAIYRKTMEQLWKNKLGA